MLDFNPHNLIDAWWQHLLMLLVAALLGYIIGYRQGRHAANLVEDQLARLGVELEKCRKSLVVIQPQLLAASLRTQRDDLKLIEGIGPKIEQVLNAGGIYTYAHLSAATVAHIRQMLDQAGAGFRIHHPESWPRQAELARDGKWDELEKWQDELDGGR